MRELKETFEKYLLEGTFYGTDNEGNRCTIINGNATRDIIDANGNKTTHRLKTVAVVLDLPMGFRVYINDHGKLDMLQTKAYQLYGAIRTLAEQKAREVCPDKELSIYTLSGKNGLHITFDVGKYDEFGGTPHHDEYEERINIVMGDECRLQLRTDSSKVYKVINSNRENANGVNVILDSESEKVIDALYYRRLEGLELDVEDLIINNNLEKEDIISGGGDTK